MPTIVPNLLKPIKIGKHNLKNRVVMAPMTRARAGAERIPNDAMAEYYAQRSGAGLIISVGYTDFPRYDELTIKATVKQMPDR